MPNNKTRHSISEIVRRMAVVHSKALMVEAAASRGLLEASLTSGNLSQFLLTEAEEDSPQFTEEDANTLAESIDSLKKSLEDLESALGETDNKFPNTIKAVQALGTEIPEIGELASMSIKGDAKGLAAKIEEVNGALSNVGKAASSVIAGVEMFAQNIAPVMKQLEEEDKEKSLEQLATDYAENDKIKFPKVEDLKKGAVKAVAVPPWYQQAFKSGMDAAKDEAGGFFAKVGSFFKGLFGDKDTGIDPNTFAEEVVKCTPAELDTVMKKVADVKSGMEESVTETATSTTAAQAGAAAAEEGESGGADLKGADKDEIIAALLAKIKALDAARAKEIEDAGDKGRESLEDEAEAIQSGEEDLETAAEDVAEEEGVGGGKSWKDVSAAVAGAVEDGKSAKTVLDTLGGADGFKDALKDKITFEEGYVPNHLRSLTGLLFEEMGFEEFASVSGAKELGDDVDKEQVLVQIATALNKEVGEDVITDIPEVEEREADEPPPADEEEAKEEQDEAQSELEGAVQDAAGSEDSPGAAIMAAIDGWYDGLSPTSQKSMDSKDRIGGLKGNLQQAIEGAAETLAKAVGDAVAKWRSEHEETLIKSKRFAKKNFDSLEKLIPQLASQLLAKTNEAGIKKLTKGMVEKFVFRALDKHFSVSSGLLSEALIPMQAINDLGSNSPYKDAWSKIAGLPYDNDYVTPAQALGEDRHVDYDEDELIAEKWRRIAGIPEER